MPEVDIQALLHLVQIGITRLQEENARLREINDYLTRALEERKEDLAKLREEKSHA